MDICFPCVIALWAGLSVRAFARTRVSACVHLHVYLFVHVDSFVIVHTYSCACVAGVSRCWCVSEGDACSCVGVLVGAQEGDL